MFAGHRYLKLLALFALFSLLLAACVRPLAPTSPAVATPAPAEPTRAPADENAAPEAEPTRAPADEPGEPIGTDIPADEPTEPAAEVAVTPEAQVTLPAEPEDTEEPLATAEPDAEATVEVAAEAAVEPTPPATEEPAATSAPEPEAAAQATPTPSRTPPPTPDTQPTVIAHTVALGENLYRIGLRYGVSWVVIAQHNNLPNADAIFAGQVLQIPIGGPAGTPTPAPTSQATPTTSGTFYTVQRGDNLFRIGQAYNVSWVLIAEANGIVNPNTIYPGQVLKIPSPAVGPTPQFTHVVQRGESLYTISLRYGVSWVAIAQANSLTSPYVIYAGQTLIIPGA